MYVAGKTRHKSKKSPVQPAGQKAAPRAEDPAARPRAPPAPGARAKVRRKPDDEGATPGMTIKKTTQRQGFKTSEFVVYPAHGVGQIVSIEEQEVAGAKLELFVISFIKDKMTLRVPTAKIVSVGMRKLAEPPIVKRALETLKGRARIKRTMWSRRAQEYEAKINSGDIVAIAEVVRDLFRSDTQPEQSYSERQLYEAALDRLSREIAAVQTRHRDRGGQGDRGRARQGPAPRSEAGRRRGRGRGRGGVTPRTLRSKFKARRQRRAFCLFGAAIARTAYK